MRVLIVDDDIQVSSMLEQMIKGWGYQAEVSGTGKDTLKKINEKTFDLILLDIFLPDTQGYELIPKLKRIWSGINIITMTGYSTKELEAKVRRQGIIYYMTKPIQLENLKSILSHTAKRLTRYRGEIKE